MIKLKQDSLALHSCDVPGYKYKMKFTWEMPRGCSASDVVYWITYAIDHSADAYLHNVVINCHGSEGAIHVGGCDNAKKKITGGTKIVAGDLAIFQTLRSKGALGTIWLVACNVARDSSDQHFGTEFCRQMAINSGCDVVAANKTQSVDVWFNSFHHPYGCIDDFEGIAYRFSPTGKFSIYSNEDD